MAQEHVDPIFNDHRQVVVLMVEGDRPHKETFADAAKAMQGEVLFCFSGMQDQF